MLPIDVGEVHDLTSESIATIESPVWTVVSRLLTVLGLPKLDETV